MFIGGRKEPVKTHKVECRGKVGFIDEARSFKGQKTIGWK